MQPPCLPCARRLGIFTYDNGAVGQFGDTCSRLAVSLSSWILDRSSISLSIPPSFHAALKRCSFLCTCSALARHVDIHATVQCYTQHGPMLTQQQHLQGNPADLSFESWIRYGTEGSPGARRGR
jgi:hypothetical protein